MMATSSFICWSEKLCAGPACGKASKAHARAAATNWRLRFIICPRADIAIVRSARQQPASQRTAAAGRLVGLDIVGLDPARRSDRNPRLGALGELPRRAEVALGE